MKNYTLSKLLIVVFVFLTANTFAQTENTKPNIILIFADDLGYTDVGFNRPANFPEEYGVIPTPELDALASNGVIAQNAHVAHPFCGPSRAALLTGVYPHRICAQYNLENSVEDLNGVTTNEKFFSKVLQENNYNTAAIGKWHVGVSNDYIPNNRGFDYFFGMLGGGHQYFESDYEAQWINSGGTVTNEYRVPLLRNQAYVTPAEFDNDEYLTDILTEEAVNYINANAADPDPFFMYLAYNAPHTPLQAPQAKIDAFDAANGDGTPGSTFSSVVANSSDILNANIPGSWTGTEAEYRATLVEDRLIYATMVSIMDEGIGLVKDALTANGILNNTLIVFMSDNGGKLRQAGAVNYPLTQGKGSVDEGGHRVPMFLHWPNQLSAGQTYDHLISSIDLYPTFLDLAGAPVPVGKLLEGKSVMNNVVANQDARPGENMYVLRPQLGFQNGAIMKGDYKIVKKGNNNTTAGFKLYNIMTDPGETTDIRGTEPNAETLIDDMLTEGVAWVSEFQDVTPCFYDNDGDGSGHPHSFLWNDGTLPNYDGFFGMPLITDPEVISITAETDAVEGQTDGSFYVSLPTGILADADITITYNVSGDAATDGSDYIVLSGTLTILEGTNGANITIVANEDGIAEGTETVLIQLASTSFGSINTTPAQINISDVTLPTSLTTGDVAIVGYKADAGNVAELAFVILKDVNPGTSITISNRSWKDDGSFNLGGGGSPYAIDDVFSWTATSTHDAGTIFKLERSGIVTTVINNVETEVGNTVQTFGTDGDWDLSPVGDSVLMYSGDTDTHPSDNSNLWLTGLNTNGVENASIQNAGWAVGGGNAYCELPVALVGFDIDVTGGDVNNPYDQNFGVYVGNTSGDAATIRASINDYTNWNLNESNAYFLWNSNDTVGANSGNIFLGQITLSSNSADEIDLGLKIFPNPTRSYIKITLNNTINDTDIELLSLTGKLIKKFKAKQNQVLSVDISDLASGMYLLKVSSDGGSQIRKIIKY